VVPIPGTKRVRYIEENAGALELKLMPEQVAQLDGLASKTAGQRYAPEMMKLVER
jgi:aryl-alcohol dehydrogenase-like predicted oxidoreductase